ncbi:MAG: Gfo/Idh/MocA family oxidoreductase [Myxococcales bacterium]
MREKLNWGVIGTGGIATDFADALVQSSRCRVVNVVGSAPAKSRAFADRWKLPKSADTLAELLADPAVDAVYVATPHPAHEAQALACIQARKAVLCEKPLTMDANSAGRLIEAARAANVFLMEAFMYRCHPLMARLIECVRDGAIGAIRHVRADFAFRVPRDPKGRLFDLTLGGGGILDVGGYPVSFARLIAGLVENKPVAEPVEFKAMGLLGPTGADEMATALLRFASGLTAAITCGVFHDAGTTAVLFGEDGKIVLPNPWIPEGKRQARETSFVIHRDGREPEAVSVTTDKATYCIEAELVADSLPALEPKWPAMTWADSLGNMRVLDRWSAAIRGDRA